jgi:aminopeptidase
MAGHRLSRFAHTIVNYSTNVGKGDLVYIRGYPFSEDALSFIREIAREVIYAGGFPHISMDHDEVVTHQLLTLGAEEQITYVDPIHAYAIEHIDVEIAIQAARNTHYLADVDPGRISVQKKAYTELTKRWFERSASKEMRWMYTSLPTSSYAQDAHMSLEEYEAFFFRTTFSDQDDPTAAWKEQRQKQEAIVDFLQDRSMIELKSPNVDLRLSMKDRMWINCAGKVNLPDGEVFTGPVEDSVEGWVRFSFPAIEAGQEVEGVELTFKQGKVVKAAAEKNEAFLRAYLNTDPGASYVGEFAFGTNERVDRFIKNILFDEKIGGTIHLALGAGYPETGSKNESAIHWDMICDMREDGEAYADGELFYRDGTFLID